MNDSLIEWTSKTWNPITGCPRPKVSPGCANCYAERTMNTRLRHLYDEERPFERIHFHLERLLQPWRVKKPSRIFVCSMGDLFHESVDDQYINLVFSVAALCRQHTFMILTKRPDRMLAVLSDRSTAACDERGHAYKSVCYRAGVDADMDGLPWPLPNVWLGVTVCNQAEADEKIPVLLQVPAAKRFVSIEPMLGPVHLGFRRAPTDRDYRGWPGDGPIDYVETTRVDEIHWVICGGETGPRARPLHPYWVRALCGECKDAGVPFFFKSWGEWKADHEYSDGLLHVDGEYVAADDIGEPWGHTTAQIARVGKRRSGRILDGREWNEVPS